MIGRESSSCAMVLIRAHDARAPARRCETNGIVTERNCRPSNCDNRLCPIVSAVTPVRSETKQIVRIGAAMLRT